MSRVEYNDGDNPSVYLWDSYVRRSTNSPRGQATLKEMEAALLALPQKRLIDNYLCRKGDVCILGAVALERRIKGGESRETAIAKLESIDDDLDLEEGSAPEYARDRLGMAFSLAWSAMEQNDEFYEGKTPEQRYEGVLAWVRERIKPEARP